MCLIYRCGFHHCLQTSDPVEELTALLGSYADSSVSSLRTFPENLSVPSSGGKESVLATEDGTDRLSRNVCKQLPLLAA